MLTIPLVNRATQGLIGTTSRMEVARDIERFDEANAEVQARLASVELDEIAADPETQRWWTFTDPLQRRREGTPDGEQWFTLDEVWHLD